jgi:hypothetical protein
VRGRGVHHSTTRPDPGRPCARRARSRHGGDDSGDRRGCAYLAPAASSARWIRHPACERPLFAATACSARSVRRVRWTIGDGGSRGGFDRDHTTTAAAVDAGSPGSFGRTVTSMRLEPEECSQSFADVADDFGGSLLFEHDSASVPVEILYVIGEDRARDPAASRQRHLKWITLHAAGNRTGDRETCFRILSAAFHKYGDAPRAARRPRRKARGGRIPGVFDRRATQRGGMHRRPNATVL